MLGEGRCAGLVLGWCFLRSRGGKTEPGDKEAILATWLRHFRDTWKLNIRVTHSDKDFSELNALAKVFPNAKGQLCFWHVLRAVKKRLAVLRRQPGYYNVTKAKNEFTFVDHRFLPRSQRTTLTESEVGHSTVANYDSNTLHRGMRRNFPL